MKYFSFFIASLISNTLAIGTRSPQESSTCSLQSLPEIVLVDIFKKVNSPSFLETSSEIYHICKSVLVELEVAQKRYIGDAPVFMSAMKRCMIKDDVMCYKIVMAYFANSNQDGPWRTAQLPALAAQLGAHRIFKELDVYKTYLENRKDKNAIPGWKEWMLRAALRKQSEFLKAFGEHDLYKGPNVPSVSAYRHLDMHLPPSVDYHDADGIRTLARNEGLKGRWEHSIYGQEEHPFQIQRVIRLLDEGDAKQLNEWKKNMKRLLASGIFLMDDVIGSSRNMIYLLWRYGTLERQKAFLDWILNEGGPIDDLPLIKNYQNIDTRNQHSYQETLHTAIEFSSGSPTESLANYMTYFAQFRHQGDTFLTVPILQVYHTVLGASLTNSRVVKAFIRFLASGQQDKDVVSYFVENGLNKKHLDKLKDGLTDGDPHRTMMLSAIQDIETRFVPVPKVEASQDNFWSISDMFTAFFNHDVVSHPI